MVRAHERGVGRLGVVGEGSVADSVAAAADTSDATAVRGSAAELVGTDLDAIAAVGEPAVVALVRAGVTTPVLPVGAGDGYGAVPEPDAVAGVESLLDDGFETDSRTVLGASVDGDPVGRAVADAMLVTSEPARISEYAIRSGGESVASVRADGIVVSTPTGSPGYGRNTGGPLLEPGGGVVGVVPIAPFAVNVDHWVLDVAEPISLTVERDDGEVELLLDGERARAVAPSARVDIVADDAVRLARVPESRRFFG
ncbi:NAD(+)/NADH kinase [Halorussus marinus]|uniref:NAD(+)/NADH kinase n=1 Tax=Halorussus marinus TaxID=2505976 RepID=UPI00106E2D82|nr:NAD(+)/NADH kinase [Halorussus marinus]